MDIPETCFDTIRGAPVSVLPSGVCGSGEVLSRSNPLFAFRLFTPRPMLIARSSVTVSIRSLLFLPLTILPASGLRGSLLWLAARSLICSSSTAENDTSTFSGMSLFGVAVFARLRLADYLGSMSFRRSFNSMLSSRSTD